MRMSDTFLPPVATILNGYDLLDLKEHPDAPKHLNDIYTELKERHGNNAHEHMQAICLMLIHARTKDSLDIADKDKFPNFAKADVVKHITKQKDLADQLLQNIKRTLREFPFAYIIQNACAHVTSLDQEGWQELSEDERLKRSAAIAQKAFEYERLQFTLQSLIDGCNAYLNNKQMFSSDLVFRQNSNENQLVYKLCLFHSDVFMGAPSRLAFFHNTAFDKSITPQDIQKMEGYNRACKFSASKKFEPYS